MSVEIAWKQNILVTDSYLLKLLLVVFGFGLQAFVCDFSRQNICSVLQVGIFSLIHFFAGEIVFVLKKLEIEETIRPPSIQLLSLI